MARYGIGIQDFREIREGGFVYVDKTPFVRKLIEGSKYYFLARPRRFGKSLFLSTLEYFFRGQRELFKGLSIYDFDWEWEEYPVVHIDLNGMDYTKDADSLNAKLEAVLSGIEEKYGISTRECRLSLRLENLVKRLHQQTGKQVVVLIDEYEKPVLDTIDNFELSDGYRETLRGFYSVLKSLDAHLKMLFVTGVTRFGRMSVFSSLNNLHDISMLVDFGAICGITERELRACFSEGIESIAKNQAIDIEETLAMLKKNYDGYHFTRECPDLYNPFSIVSAMATGEMDSYWFSTGTPNLLANLLLKNNYDIEGLEGTPVLESTIKDIGNLDNPLSLFYQTGYLTIKKYDRTTKIYTLGFPNQEVEVAFYEFLLPYYMKAPNKNTASYFSDFVGGLQTGNPHKAMEALEAFSAGINYEILPAPEVERHFQQMVYAFSRLLLPYTTLVKTEERTSDGRIDLLIQTNGYVYVIEMKRDSSPQEALSQIKDRQYALAYKTDVRTTFLIGINFSTSGRRLEGYAIEKYSR